MTSFHVSLMKINKQNEYYYYYLSSNTAYDIQRMASSLIGALFFPKHFFLWNSPIRLNVQRTNCRIISFKFGFSIVPLIESECNNIIIFHFNLFPVISIKQDTKLRNTEWSSNLKGINTYRTMKCHCLLFSYGKDYEMGRSEKNVRERIRRHWFGACIMYIILWWINKNQFHLPFDIRMME